jgi:hypothetical protein
MTAWDIITFLGAMSQIGSFVLLGITVWLSHVKNVPMTVVWEGHRPKQDGEC